MVEQMVFMLEGQCAAEFKGSCWIILVKGTETPVFVVEVDEAKLEVSLQSGCTDSDGMKAVPGRLSCSSKM